jgi:uncharacterized membrane protein YdfJ with MMPL/SSD domain
MKTITECESKHCKAWPLFSLVCAGVIATFMAGCAVREIPEYHSSSYYPAGIQAARGGLAVQEIVPFESESSWQVKY